MFDNGISFTDPEVQKCPFHAYAAIRPSAPVYRDPVNGFFIVTDYQLAQKVAFDTAAFSSETGLLLVKQSKQKALLDEIWRVNGVPPVNVLVVKDPPEHKMYRSLVDKAFTPLRVKQMEDYLASIVDDMIDGFIENGQVDFHSAMSVLVPLSVIADQLGLARSDLRRFKSWSDAVIRECDQSNSAQDEIEITHTICEMQRYVIGKAHQYKESPAECILSDLANAQVDGRRLTDSELVSIIAQALTAGNETTAATMSSAMIRIIDTPGLESTLRDSPQQIPAFIEEVLRLDSAIQGLFRRATRDMELAGVAIPAESIVVIKWGAANRDPAVFSDPDLLDITRPNSRRHIAFGFGPHHCVGNQLARGELRIAIGRILQRMANFRYARGEDSIVRVPHYFAYGASQLHIAFDKT